MARPRKFDEDLALAKAMDVFWEKGFAETNVQDLCAAMGINAGSLYASFGAKQDVFLAAIKRYIATVTDEGVAQIRRAPSGVDGIRSYFDYVISGVTSGKRRHGCFGTNSFLELRSSQNEAVDIVACHFHYLETAFLEALTADKVENPASHAKHFVCLAQGLNVMALTRPGADQLWQIIDTALARIEPERESTAA